jgi:hypothetical protein
MRSATATDGLIDLSDPGLCQARRPILVAHRGGTVGPGAPENSLAAIRGAATAGFDIQTSADDEPVLFHDDWSGTLRVSCGVDHLVHELTLEELRGCGAAKPRARHKSAMLKVWWKSSGCCSRQSWPGFVRARISYSRTCCRAISSPSSPVRLEPDRVLSFTPGTSCSGPWLANCVR